MYLIENIKKQGVIEVTLAYRENGKGKKEHERISPYLLKFDKNGEPNFKYGVDSELRRAEAEGMRSMWELANEGKEFIVWISPSGGEENYPEGRIVAGWVKKIGDETEIECRGIPILENGEKLKAMSENLMGRGAVSMDEIREIEDLRKEALGINCQSWPDFLNICEEVFGNSEVWEAIRSGGDVVATKETEKVVVDVMAELKIRGWENSPYNLEQLMARRGYVLMTGNHGGSNLQTGAFNIVFGISKIDNLDSRLEQCSQCGRCYMKKKGRCPNCYPEN